MGRGRDTEGGAAAEAGSFREGAVWLSWVVIPGVRGAGCWQPGQLLTNYSSTEYLGNYGGVVGGSSFGDEEQEQEQEQSGRCGAGSAGCPSPSFLGKAQVRPSSWVLGARQHDMHGRGGRLGVLTEKGDDDAADDDDHVS
jgi:hypothetical protein